MSNSKNVMDFRRRIKLALIKGFNDKCHICGESFPIFVYEFHHIDPSLKSFSISGNGITYSKDKVCAEAKKCVMVCANCHRFIEYDDKDYSYLQSDFNEEIYYQTLDELTRKNKEIIQKREPAVSKKPDRETLKKQIRTLPFLQIGKLYDVSDNAVRKWCKSYDLPSRVSDIKLISDEEWERI